MENEKVFAADGFIRDCHPRTVASYGGLFSNHKLENPSVNQHYIPINKNRSPTVATHFKTSWRPRLGVCSGFVWGRGSPFTRIPAWEYTWTFAWIPGWSSKDRMSRAATKASMARMLCQYIFHSHHYYLARFLFSTLIPNLLQERCHKTV
jgi:hypothetical protein